MVSHVGRYDQPFSKHLDPGRPLVDLLSSCTMSLFLFDMPRRWLLSGSNRRFDNIFPGIYDRHKMNCCFARLSLMLAYVF